MSGRSTAVLGTLYSVKSSRVRNQSQERLGSGVGVGWFGSKQLILQALQKIVQIEEDEMEPLMNGAGCYFSCLAGFFVIQPLRDEVAVSLGTSTLPFLFTVSLLVTAVVSPAASSYTISFTPRKSGGAVHFIFRLMAAVTVGFYLSYMVGEMLRRRSTMVAELTIETSPKHLLPQGQLQASERGRIQSSADFAWKVGFFVWVNLQNVVATSTMWSRLADAFSSDSGARLFGLVGAGATLGQLVASAVAIFWAGMVKQYAPSGLAKVLMNQLLLVSALLMELAGTLLAGVSRHAPASRLGDSPVRGLRVESRAGDVKRMQSRRTGLLNGLKLILASSYLRHLCLYLLMGSFISSLFYFTKTSVVSRSSLVDSSSRSAWFASVNFSSAFVIFFLQVTASGRVLHGLGVATSLAFTPVMSGVLMAAVAFRPSPVTVAVAEVLRKLSTYVISRVAREVLFTVVSREEKYQAKVIIDTVVLRLGDTAAAGLFSLLDASMVLNPSLVATIASGITALWAIVAFTLGIRQMAMARKELVAQLSQKGERGGAKSLAV